MLLTEGTQVAAALEYFDRHRDSVDIQGSLISQELVDREPWSWLCAAKTVSLAFRLHHHRAGTMKIFGKKEAGRDVLWTPKNGAPVSMECKTRNWEVEWKTPRWRRWVLDRLKESRDGLLRHKTLRVPFLHFSTSPEKAREIQDSVVSIVKSGRDTTEGLLGVCVAAVGYYIGSGGVPQAVNSANFIDLRTGRIRGAQRVTSEAFEDFFSRPWDDLPAEAQ